MYDMKKVLITELLIEKETGKEFYYPTR